MRWDIFCRVIDNHGDAGVCWRLAAALADQSEAVRLWIDEPDALAWMAPGGHPGVRLIHWRDDEANRATMAAAAAEAPPEVLIEAFGCDPLPAVVEAFARARLGAGAGHRWINLEYLSAEPYVERLHGLPSPVFKGPGAGLTKHFFYPGFRPATGGLLRETALMTERAAFDRAAWLQQHGIAWQGERLVSLFCYEPAELPALLARWERASQPTRLLVTAGRASAALPPGPPQRGALTIDWLPYLPQTEFDRLLWACDFDFVRGEDSLVRALWAGVPFCWQIYPQDDDAHHVKLAALLDWMQAPASLRQLHLAWNGISEAAALPDFDGAALDSWRACILAARAGLLTQEDLCTRLRRFVAQKS